MINQYLLNSIKDDACAIENVDDSLLNDEEFILTAIQANAEVLYYLGTPTRLKPMGILNYLKKVILGLLANS